MSKRITIEIPDDLYERFSNSNLRKESASESEAIRTAIKNILDGENENK